MSEELIRRKLNIQQENLQLILFFLRNKNKDFTLREIATMNNKTVRYITVRFNYLKSRDIIQELISMDKKFKVYKTFKLKERFIRQLEQTVLELECETRRLIEELRKNILK
ncbi:MAG: hypothetical protein ACOC1K_07970 [Nanoarchaeota archaeon]